MSEIDILLVGEGGCGKTTFIDTLRPSFNIHRDADEGGEIEEVYKIIHDGSYNVYVTNRMAIDRSFNYIAHMCKDRFSPLPSANINIINLYPDNLMNNTANTMIADLQENYPDRTFIDVRGDVGNTTSAAVIWRQITEFIHG